MTLAAKSKIKTEPEIDFPHFVRAIPDGQIGIDVLMRRVAMEVQYLDGEGEVARVCRGITAHDARTLARHLMAAAKVAEGR